MFDNGRRVKQYGGIKLCLRCYKLKFVILNRNIYQKNCRSRKTFDDREGKWMRSDDMGEKDPKLEDNAAEGGRLNEDHSEDSSGSCDDNN